MFSHLIDEDVTGRNGRLGLKTIRFSLRKGPSYVSVHESMDFVARTLPFFFVEQEYKSQLSGLGAAPRPLEGLAEGVQEVLRIEGRVCQ